MESIYVVGNVWNSDYIEYLVILQNAENWLAMYETINISHIA